MTFYERQRCLSCEAAMTATSVYCDVCGTWQAAQRTYEAHLHRHPFGIQLIDWNLKKRCALTVIGLIVTVWLAFIIL